jgi:hypothetical protein
MRGVSVRGAGGLVIGVVIQPILLVLDYPMALRGAGIVNMFRTVFWVPEGADLPLNTMAFLVLRLVLVFAGLILGVLAVLGVRPVRFPLAAVCGALAVGVLVWVIWPFDPVDFRNLPPNWVLDHPLWFRSTRGTAIVVLVMLLSALVLAVTDSGRVASPAPASAGGWGPAGPYGPGPYAAPGPYAGQPSPSGQWAPVPAPGAPGAPAPPGTTAPSPSDRPPPPAPAPAEPDDSPQDTPPPDDDGPHGARTPF